MRILFALKRVEVVGGLKDFIMRSFMTCLPHPVLLGDQERRMRWAGHVARMGEMRNVYGVLVGKLEGNRPLGRPRNRGEDNIRVDVREKW
jgi:hypothetical protein